MQGPSVILAGILEEVQGFWLSAGGGVKLCKGASEVSGYARMTSVRYTTSQRLRLSLMGAVAAVLFLVCQGTGRTARAQRTAASEVQVSFCRIEIPARQQQGNDSVAFRFRVNPQGSPTGITLVRRGLAVIDDEPFRDCISKWRLPFTDQQYLATFSTHDTAVWQEIDVDSKTFHRKLLAKTP